MATRLGLGDLDVTDRSPGLRLEGTLKRGFGDFEQLKKAWHSDVFYLVKYPFALLNAILTRFGKAPYFFCPCRCNAL